MIGNNFDAGIVLLIAKKEISGIVRCESGVQVVEITEETETPGIAFTLRLADGREVRCDFEGNIIGTADHLVIEKCIYAELREGDYIKFPNSGDLMCQISAKISHTTFVASIYVPGSDGEVEFNKTVTDQNLGFCENFWPDSSFYRDILTKTGKLWVDEKNSFTPSVGHLVEDLPKKGDWIFAMWPPSPYEWMGKRSEDYFPQGRYSLVTEDFSLNSDGFSIGCSLTSADPKMARLLAGNGPIKVSVEELIKLDQVRICRTDEKILLWGISRELGYNPNTGQVRPDFDLMDKILVVEEGIWEIALFGRWVTGTTLAVVGGKHYEEGQWNKYDEDLIGTEYEKPIE